MKHANRVILLVMTLWLVVEARAERRSLLNSDPDVVYLAEVSDRPLELEVIQDAPVFGDKEGNRRLGVLVAGQVVQVEALSDRAYRVRGQGRRHGISGWVGPWAFKSPMPEFADRMKRFYEREMKVKALIEEGRVVIGMTPAEVAKVMGEPTKSTMRLTREGQQGSWEYIEYDEVRHYATHVDPLTGMVYRQLVSVTREETEKTVIDFEEGYVVALEESENQQGAVRVILPRVACAW